jgi:hypothetical protein
MFTTWRWKARGTEAGQPPGRWRATRWRQQSGAGGSRRCCARPRTCANGARACVHVRVRMCVSASCVQHLLGAWGPSKSAPLDRIRTLLGPQVHVLGAQGPSRVRRTHCRMRLSVGMAVMYARTHTYAVPRHTWMRMGMAFQMRSLSLAWCARCWRCGEVQEVQRMCVHGHGMRACMHACAQQPPFCALAA